MMGYSCSQKIIERSMMEAVRKSVLVALNVQDNCQNVSAVQKNVFFSVVDNNQPKTPV